MDRLVFAAMTGARAAVNQLAITANNLSNAATPGFREQIAAFRAVPMGGDGANTRAFTLDTTPGSNFSMGVVEATNNPMDLALSDGAYLVLRRQDGREALTRAGRMSVSTTGELRGALGLPLVGETGPIVVPPNTIPQIGEDGTVTIFDPNSPQPQIIGRLRLAKAEGTTLTRAPDGLFELPAGTTPRSDPSVAVKQGFIEGSNVSVASAMIAMVSQQRMFDMNMKMIQSADMNARSANGIMSLSRG